MEPTCSCVVCSTLMISVPTGTRMILGRNLGSELMSDFASRDVHGFQEPEFRWDQC